MANNVNHLCLSLFVDEKCSLWDCRNDAHKELCTANLTIVNKLIKNALHTTWQTYTLFVTLKT
ncbi:hypothetical protein AtNW77_Chr1g0072611 [Arabidopsis thaliana]